jgi:hypothetical protein
MKEIKKTNYSSFISFCNGMAYSLSHGSLYSVEKDIIINITNMLDVIYSMDDTLTANYIVRFFNLETERLSNLNRCVMETNEFYPMSSG